MQSVELSAARLAAFAALPEPDGPVTMLNLLRFREQADYSGYPDVEPCRGVEAFRRYGEIAFPCVAAAGGKIVYVGTILAGVICRRDEHWLDIWLVEYQSRQALVDMFSSPAYRAGSFHRTAALADSRLIATLAGIASFEV
jgi:uncharacterized protein (DUF1330 family)